MLPVLIFFAIRKSSSENKFITNTRFLYNLLKLSLKIDDLRSGICQIMWEHHIYFVFGKLIGQFARSRQQTPMETLLFVDLISVVLNVITTGYWIRTI